MEKEKPYVSCLHPFLILCSLPMDELRAKRMRFLEPMHEPENTVGAQPENAVGAQPRNAVGAQPGDIANDQPGDIANDQPLDVAIDVATAQPARPCGPAVTNYVTINVGKSTISFPSLSDSFLFFAEHCMGGCAHQ